MLVADKKTISNLKERLSEFSKFGMTFYYLLEQGKISFNEIEEIFFSKDSEKSTFRYINAMKKVVPDDINNAFSKYQDYFPRGNMTDKEYETKLNLIFTSKIIHDIVGHFDKGIDKTYVNTYNYLLDSNNTENLNYSYGK